MSVSALLVHPSLSHCRRTLTRFNLSAGGSLSTLKQPFVFSKRLSSDFLVRQEDRIQARGVVPSHRSLLLQLFNINAVQVFLSRGFIFTNITKAAFLLSPRPHSFTPCLTRQLHSRGAERPALSCRVRTDGPVTLLSYKNRLQ